MVPSSYCWHSYTSSKWDINFVFILNLKAWHDQLFHEAAPGSNDNYVEQAGLTAADEEIADWLRKNYSDKYIIVAVNKCESPRKRIMQASEFWSLG